MERYTDRNERGDLLLCGNEVYGNNQDAYNAITQLEDYEDTGLTPEEIIQLNDFSQSQCAKLIAEVEQLKEKLQESPYGDDKIDELEESCDNLRFQLEQKGQQADALKKKLCQYAGCYECKIRDTAGCAEAFFHDDCHKWEWKGIQQAQEQEGKK